MSEQPKIPLWKRKWVRRSAVAVLLLIVLFALRVPLLRGVGHFLISEDPVSAVDVVFVLGGNSLDRGSEAARLWHDQVSQRVVCSGGNRPSVLEAIGIPMYEHEITRQLLINKGVDSTSVDVLTTATSTREEAAEIEQYCREHGVQSAMIVSSKFHLRRVRGVFEEAFEDSDTQLQFHGAPSTDYDEELWWQSEAGLIMVNNEYVKLFYYWLKY